jgi:hypothetical protein
VLSEIKYRGTREVLIVCDGLKGLPDAVNSVWEKKVRCHGRPLTGEHGRRRWHLMSPFLVAENCRKCGDPLDVSH